MTRSVPPELLARLRAARRITALTGSGVSAESGIPTFRDALTGLWSRFRPEELATPEAFARNPRLVWDWYAARRAAVRAAAPNAGHRALARLQILVPHFTLITQNVDGLHQRAGSRDVIELHGSIARVRCAREGTIVERWSQGDDVPRCASCGAFLRPDVVWFGEMLPQAATEAAVAAARACDLFLSVGTSNLVQPAASLPWLAAAHGATVVVVNPSMEGQPEGPGIFRLTGPAGEILPRLVQALEPGAPAVPRSPG
ncbi:MAG TPA: NAD-dependent deacylase [Gemmatimonadales bacterium]|nr:NAD-dependent deacylase [Gemmatimonadales bacterium]